MLWSQNYMPYSYTINDVTDKYATFLCEFVDLKRNGYLHYTKAVDNLTYGFWGPWLRESDKVVSNFAEHLKLVIKLK